MLRQYDDGEERSDKKDKQVYDLKEGKKDDEDEEDYELSGLLSDSAQDQPESLQISNTNNSVSVAANNKVDQESINKRSTDRFKYVESIIFNQPHELSENQDKETTGKNVGNKKNKPQKHLSNIEMAELEFNDEQPESDSKKKIFKRQMTG